MSNKTQFIEILSLSQEEFGRFQYSKPGFGYDDWCASVLDYPEGQSLLKEKTNFTDVMDWEDMVSHRDPEVQREKILKKFVLFNSLGGDIS
jgi:hypothetical protein